MNHFGSSAILKSDRGSSMLLPLSMAKVQLSEVGPHRVRGPVILLTVTRHHRSPISR